jgi:hypothetical protein
VPLEPDVDLGKFQNNKVIIQVLLDTPNEKGETLIELEGKAEAANALGVLIKPKGRTQVELIERAKIESIELAPESEKKLTARSILPVEFGKVRQHLLDRHGYTLDQVNALTEEAADEFHKDLTHTELGHKHEEKKPAEERAEGLEEAAAEPAA